MALGSLRERAAFEELLGTRPMARSAHFAVHCLPLQAKGVATASGSAANGNLSTDEEQILSSPVDKLAPRHFLGCVLPKRLVRRAVSRNLLRREIRSAISSRIGELTPGCWLVRLRAPWPVAQWRSAASMALRRAVRAELVVVVDACVGAQASAGARRPGRQGA